MDFTNWLSESTRVVIEAAEQAFGLKDFVRMSGNAETTFYAELETACEDFKAELIKRGEWEDFATSLGMDI